MRIHSCVCYGLGPQGGLRWPELQQEASSLLTRLERALLGFRDRPLDFYLRRNIFCSSQEIMLKNGVQVLSNGGLAGDKT